MIIKFTNVTVSEYLYGVSFSISEEERCKIIVYSDYLKNLIIELMMGLGSPDGGSIYLFNDDIATLSENKLNEVRIRCGVILSGGGLISNLEIRDNLTLPLKYHTLMTNTEIESKLMGAMELTGITAFHENDFEEYLSQLPGPLSTYEKRLVALSRAFAIDPDLLIYESIFEGIPAEMAKKIRDLTESFHYKKPGRTSIYLTINEDSLKYIETDCQVKIMS